MKFGVGKKSSVEWVDENSETIFKANDVELNFNVEDTYEEVNIKGLQRKVQTGQTVNIIIPTVEQFLEEKRKYFPRK